MATNHRRDRRDQISKWLTAFAMTCSGAGINELADKLRVYATDLDAERLLPTSLFDDETRRAAAHEFAFFPAYLDLSRFLFDQQEKRAPKGRPLPGPTDQGWTAEDHAHLRTWNTRRAEGFADTQGGAPITDPHMLRQRMTRSLDVLRGRNRRVFGYVIQTDLEAASIAVQRGWTEGRRDDDWKDPERLKKSIARLMAPLPTGEGELKFGPMRRAYLDLLRKAVETNAPENLALLEAEIARFWGTPSENARGSTQTAPDAPPHPNPSDAAKTRQERFYARHGRYPGQLSPDQLAEARRSARYTLPDAPPPAPPPKADQPPDDGWTPSWERGEDRN